MLENVRKIEKILVFLNIAKELSKLSTCNRRAVGCIILDDMDRIISSGYNGVSKGSTHCIKNQCAGAFSPSNTDLNKCEAIHAEQNALMQCQDIYKINTIITTTSPCMHCAKLIANTSCKKVYFVNDAYDYDAINYLENKGIKCIRILESKEIK